MLTPTTKPITEFRDSFKPTTEYLLRNVQLEIPDQRTAIFKAFANGPVGENAWVRAWIGNESEGTLAQAEIANVLVGEEVTLTVLLDGDSVPELACMRIESEQFATKHTVHIEL